MITVISLIVSTYNRPDALELVLLSIARQHLPKAISSNLEVIIADDGSTDDTARLIKQLQARFPFKLIHSWHPDEGFRAGAARNLAVSKSRGDYLIFIDGDCLISSDFISMHYQLAQKNYLVAGNRILLSKKYTQQCLIKHDISVVNANWYQAVFAKLSGKTNKILHLLRLSPNSNWRINNPENWRRPKSCNLSLWRSDFGLVNGFDEDFYGWGHEDADLVIRLIHAGVKVKDGRFAAAVYHLWHPTNDRSRESQNIAKLNQRLQDKSIIRAQSGIDKYLL